MTGEEMVLQYIKAKGLEESTAPFEVESFGDSAEMSVRLLELILAGKKRATCWVCLDETPPLPGVLSAVTDRAGNAGAVLETVRAQVMRFCDMTWALARLEGENDCFADWHREHIRFFSQEGQRAGYVFSEKMSIIFEEFKVVWPEEYADEI